MGAIRHFVAIACIAVFGALFALGEASHGCADHESDQHGPETIPCTCLCHSSAVESSCEASVMIVHVRPVFHVPAGEILPDFLLDRLIFQPPRA